MPFDRASTSLAFLEEKFRNFFRLAGNIGASFAPDIRPAYIVGDARDPGVASFSGRHWAWISEEITAPSAANDSLGLKFPVAVIVRGIALLGSMATSSRLHAFVLAPDDAAIASIFTVERQAGTWIDQKARDADLVPFVDRGNAPVVVPVVVANQQLKRISSWANGPAGGTTPQAVHTINMHVPAGGAIVWTAALAAASFARVGLWGQVA